MVALTDEEGAREHLIRLTEGIDTTEDELDPNVVEGLGVLMDAIAESAPKALIKARQLIADVLKAQSVPHPNSLAIERLRPHACVDGWVFVGYVDEDGEEREASYACHRCADSSRGR